MYMSQGKKVLDRINMFFVSAFRKKKRSCTILLILSEGLNGHIQDSTTLPVNFASMPDD
jgi:hypothetical protein